ncbi:zinc chelation protein SecC [Methylophaga sp. 42_25_T18]|nr:zinc chelation protein SecC [Methylophaga sp. 42_25_T18]OUR88034.1 zinc chelation protein SecC [Methylophaga sp. 42_8_T64]
MSENPKLCPCISGLSYSACCQPLHDGKLTASSAEQLMCSRYSAFYLGNIAYLISTLHPNVRQKDDKQTLAQTIEQTQWLGLKIINHKPSAKTATVEFIAFYQDNPIGQLHEQSRFIQEDEQWYYTDGDILEPIKLSRNEACFCGSGKKLKRCHML